MRERMIRTGARPVHYARHPHFQFADAVLPRQLLTSIVGLINDLRGSPAEPLSDARNRNELSRTHRWWRKTCDLRRPDCFPRGPAGPSACFPLWIRIILQAPWADSRLSVGLVDGLVLPWRGCLIERSAAKGGMVPLDILEGTHPGRRR